MRFTLSAAAALLAFVPALAAPTGTSLAERAVGCKSTFQCRTLYRPSNSVATCIDNACGYVCLDGYSSTLGRVGQCTLIPTSSSAAVVSTSTTLPPSTTTTTTSAAPSPTVTITPNAMVAAGVTGFQGNNTNAILSWYNTNSAKDSTNGNSWCGYPYTNDVPGVAPSLKTMLNNFGGNYEAAARAYCGLELVVSTPDGRNKTMYIADAFDDAWVLTPSSLDIIHNSFTDLFGRWTDNKLDVVKRASWQFTGNRNERYRFKGDGARGL